MGESGGLLGVSSLVFSYPFLGGGGLEVGYGAGFGGRWVGFWKGC